MIDKSVSKLNKWEAALRKIGSFITTTFVAALAAGIIAIGSLTTAGVGLAASFENAFADVTKTVDVFIDRTATAEQGFITLTEAGESFRKSLIGLSNRIPVTFEELSAIAGLGGQLGVINDLAGPEAEDALLKFTETVAGLAEATNLTQEVAGTGLAQISNVFRESIDDIGDNIERLGSTVVELGNTSATTESKILNFTSRIAGASQTIGILQPEMLGIATAFSAIGLTAEAGSTAVNRAFLIMNQAVNESSEAFIDNSTQIGKIEESLSKLNAKLVRGERGEEGLARSIQAQRDEWLEAGKAVEDFGRQLGDARREQLFRTQDEIDKLTAKLQTLKITQGQAINTEVFDEFLRVINQVRIGTELTSEEFRKLFKDDPAEAFTLFIEGLALEGDRAGEVLANLGLNSVEAQRAFLAIAGASDSVRESILRATEAFEANTALAEEVAVRYATLVSQLDTLKNVARNTSAELFDGMIPSLIGLVEETGQVIEVLGNKLPQTFSILKDKTLPEIKRAFGEIILPDFDPSTDLMFAFDTLNLRLQALDFTPLGDKLIAFRDGPLSVLKETLAIVRENADLVTGAIKGLATLAAGSFMFNAITKLTGLLLALTTPMGLLIGAAITLGVAWETNFGGIQEKVSAFVETVKPKIDEITGLVTKLWEVFQMPPGFEGSILTGEVQETPSGFSGVMSEIKELSPEIDAFIGKMERLWEIMQAPPGFEGIIPTGEVRVLPSGLDGVLAEIKKTEGLAKALESLNKQFEPFIGANGMFGDFGPFAKELIIFWERLVEQVKLFFNTLDFSTGWANFIASLKVLGPIGENILSFFNQLGKVDWGMITGEVVNLLGNTFLTTLANIILSVEGLTRALDGLASGDFSRMGSGLLDWLGNLGQALITPILTLTTDVLDPLAQKAVDSFIKALGNNFKDPTAWGLLFSDVSVPESTVNEVSNALVGSLGNIVQKTIDGFKSKFSEAPFSINWLTDVIKIEAINTSENFNKIGKELQLLFNALASDKFITEILADVQIQPPDFSLIGLKVLTSVDQTREAFRTALFNLGIEPPSFQKVLDKAKEIVDTIKGWMESVFDFDIPFLPNLGIIDGPDVDISALDRVPEDVADSLIHGLEGEESRWTKAWEDWFVEPINSGIDAGKDVLGIKSPSKVTEQMGVDTVDGFVMGLQEGDKLDNWMTSLTNLIVIGFQGIVSEVNSNTIPTLNNLEVEFIGLYQETLPLTTSAIVDDLIPAKIDLAETNELVLVPSVERLISAEDLLASTITSNVVPVLDRAITLKDNLTDETKGLKKEVDKLTKSYKLLADAIASAVNSGSSSIGVPGSTIVPGPAGTPQFQSGGSFVVPSSVGPDGMQITVHPNELVNILPANKIKQPTAPHSVPVLPPIMVDRTVRPFGNFVKSPSISGATLNMANSGNTTNVTENKEFHLHVNQSVGPEVMENFELLEALS